MVSIRPWCLSLLLVALPLPAAQVLLGNSPAQICYDYAKGEGDTPRRAMEACDRAIRDEGLRPADRAATYSNRGILHARRGHYARAVRDYDRALDINPTLVDAMINRGIARARLGQYREALDDYDLASFYSEGGRSLVFFNRAMLFKQMGRLERAREDLLRALQLQPESLAYREALARLE